MALFGIHAGSWTIPGTNIPLPDIGATEFVGDIFGVPKNLQGGSQLRQGTIFNIGNVPLEQAQTPQQQATFTTGKTPRTYSYYGGQAGKVSTLPSTQQPPPQQQPPPVDNPNAISELRHIRSRGANVGDVREFGGRLWRWNGEVWEPLSTPGSNEVAEREARIRGSIESAYGDYMRRLDEMAGIFPQWETEDISALEKSKTAGLGELETAKTGALNKLGLAREQAKTEESQAKADIMSQLRQLLKASQMKAGILGAGWSSATQEVLPSILGKQAAQAGSQVARGTIANLNQIAQKEVDIQTTYDIEKQNLEQDFNNRLTEIRDKYRQLKTWVDTEKANASLKKAQALQNLDQQLLSNAINEINYWRQQYFNQRQALENWARERIAQLQDYKIKLGQMGNFSPVALTWEALQGLGGLTGRTGGEGLDVFGSLVDIGKKRRGELLGY